MTDQERIAAALAYQGATAAPPTMAQELAKVPSRLIGALKALGTGSSYGSAEPVNAVNDLARTKFWRGSVFGVPEDVQQRNVDRAMEAASTAAPIKRAFSAPQDEALRLAQQRAALPVERGGLGLPPNNTAEQRAQAMGFLNNVYHGTNADIQAMNVAGKGKTAGAGVFVTDNPLVAETYFSGSGEGNILPLLLKKEGLLSVNAKGRNWADIDTNTLAAKAGKKRYSLADMELDKNSATSTDELGIIAKDLLGLKGVEIKNVKDLGPNSHIFRAKEYLKEKYGITPNETWSNVTGNQFAEAKDYMEKLYKSQKNTVTSIQDSDLLRSRFAAFDPFRRNAATAAAMGVAAPDLLAKEKNK